MAVVTSPNYLGEGATRAHFVERGSGTPVVLVHGGGAGADTYSNFGAALPVLAEHYRVIGVDMLGFGRSAMPEPSGFEYSQAARQNHLATFLEELGLGPYHVVGNSMGGATALGVAMAQPNLFRSLTLMGTAGRSDHHEITSNPALAPLLNYDGTTDGMRALLGALTHGFEAPDELIEYRVERSADPQVRAAYRATMAWVREHGLTFDMADIAAVTVPTLVVHGRHDQVVPLGHALEIVEAIHDASLAVFGQSGHLVMLENVSLFCDTVTAFWRDVDARGGRP